MDRPNLFDKNSRSRVENLAIPVTEHFFSANTFNLEQIVVYYMMKFEGIKNLILVAEDNVYDFEEYETDPLALHEPLNIDVVEQVVNAWASKESFQRDELPATQLPKMEFEWLHLDHAVLKNLLAKHMGEKRMAVPHI